MVQASATNLFLDFWARAVNSPTLFVDLSGDGATWQNVFSSTLGTGQVNFTLDLDALAAGKSIALDADVYIRFRDRAGYTSTHDLFLDDVRIVRGDLAGPKVLSHSPTALAANAGPLNGIRLTFNESILESSFTAADVVLRDPQGNVIAATGVTPVAGSDNTQFDISFAGQELRGIYRLVVGPNVTDLAGNLMNQNANAVNGEAADSYAGTVSYAPTVATPPRLAPPTCTSRASRPGRPRPAAGPSTPAGAPSRRCPPARRTAAASTCSSTGPPPPTSTPGGPWTSPPTAPTPT